MVVLEDIAKQLSHERFRVIFLGQGLKPIGDWADYREIPLTESEIYDYFHNGKVKPTGLAIALHGKGVRLIVIDIDGKDAEEVFFNEFMPLLPKEIQIQIKKAPRTGTKSGGLHMLLRIEEAFTDIIKQKPEWSKTIIECANGNTKHSEINVLGTEFMSREFGPGYKTIVSLLDSEIRFKKSDIDVILQTFVDFKKATQMIKISGDVLIPLWQSPNRDDIVFSTSGFLGKNGKVPENLTVRLFNHILRVTALSDDSKEHTLKVIHDTYEKIANGGIVSGYERFKAVVKHDSIINEIQAAFKQLGHFPDYFNENEVPSGSEYYYYHNENKKAVLRKIPDESIRSMLLSDIWTMVSENPLKFIIARKQACYVCRASLTYSDSGDDQMSTKKAHLNYGSILIRLYPKQITLHESPLAFLETPPKYTIIFENQQHKEVHVSGTIETIVTKLKEMPGYVVSSYGITEALTAIIGAFTDDMKLLIDKTVDFEGYFFYDNDIQISRIDLDKKHPRRSKEEVIDCIKYLEERSKFQIWKYKEQTTIDRRDLLASLIKWGIPGPFNFALKQQGCKPYLKGFAMTGERDGGKTDMSKEILNMHSNPTNEQDADSIYSVSSGSADTAAKFGQTLSKTTYPVEISENSTVESYGRGENLVEPYKTSVDTLIVRRGKKANRTDAPFPSLPPLIINGNPPFSFKGELLKRFHVAKFSEEDRHSRDINTDYNKFQRDNGHLLRILGDWTVRYILDNKQELLLSKKYNPYQISDISLEAFYRFGNDSRVPDWLKKWIVDKSLEELDQDIDEIIRSILYNHVHKTIRENSSLLDLDDGINQTMSMRIQLCIDSELWAFVKPVGATSGKPATTYYLTSSLLELFKQRLPDLTLKKLAEKTGFKYMQGKDGKMKLQCSKTDLDNFITGGKEEE